MTLDEFRQQTKLLPGGTQLLIHAGRIQEPKLVADMAWSPAENKLVLEAKKETSR
jgi:hypothetical protein